MKNTLSTPLEQRTDSLLHIKHHKIRSTFFNPFVHRGIYTLREFYMKHVMEVFPSNAY